MLNEQRNVPSALGRLQPVEEVFKTPGLIVECDQMGPAGKSLLPKSIEQRWHWTLRSCVSLEVGQRLWRETLLLLLHVCGLGWSSDSSRDKLEAARVRRCLSLENHITSLRLALGQGRESAERLVFQEAA